MAKMEVDSWVSVQARREQFEQLYEDSPVVSPQKTPSFQPTPRPRTLSIPNKISPSIPNKLSPNCDELRAYHGKNTQSFYHEFNGKDKFSPNNNGPTSKNADVLNSGQLPKNNIVPRKHINSPSPRNEDFSHNPVTPKSTPTKVIPVFRPSCAAADRINIEGEKTATPTDASQGKRGRFFSHIRSRSHGNFIVKRDPSEERVSSAGQKNGVTSPKENKFHKDWLTPKRKQRSIDDLLTTNDSSSSSFEGKQRLVSNVVKNMKNKETPTVLRKLSFSSKNEKDIKNMKEKSDVPNKSNKQSALLTSLSGKTGIVHLSNRQKSNSRNSGINANQKPGSEEKPASLTSHSNMGNVPELIAKEVAEVASKRYSAQTNDTTTSSSSDDRLSDPPERPPRRRTPCPGHPPRRKSKAPTPPSQFSRSAVEQSNDHSDTSLKIPQDDSSKTIWGRFRDSSSLDNLESPASTPSSHLVVRSCENLPDVVHTSSPSSPPGIFHTNLKPARRSHENRQDSGSSDREQPSKPSHASVKNAHANQVMGSQITDESSRERNKTEVEGLPGGPPPKKPPRTFAYDIYKNVSTSTPEVKGEERGKKETPTAKNAQPIYAVPVKKSNKMTPKPPVRSKSDLTKENAKPSVAPKPPHVLAKAKRTSLADPLSSLEKEEEAAITSEFQRQAHVRYSLRKPNEPPPGQEGNSPSDSKSKLSINSLENHDTGYTTVYYDKENYNPNAQRDVTLNISNSYGSEGKSPCPPDNCPSDYENSTPITSSFAVSSCHDGRNGSENEQPLSLTYCFANTPTPDVTYTHTKRSMSDETLYKVSAYP